MSLGIKVSKEAEHPVPSFPHEALQDIAHSNVSCRSLLDWHHSPAELGWRNTALISPSMASWMEVRWGVLQPSVWILGIISVQKEW